MKVVALFSFLIVWLSAGAQKPVVKASFDRNTILIGEPITVTISLKAAPAEALVMPDTLPHFEKLSASKIDSVADGQQLELRQSFTYTSWDSGRWVFPAVDIGGAATQPFRISVGHTPFNYNQDYNDIKDIVESPRRRSPTWWWYAALLAILAVLYYLFFPSAKKDPAEQVLDPGIYKKTLQRLDALEKNSELGQQPKAFYTELVDAFRIYLDRRKGLRSTSQTSEEISAALSGLKIETEVRNEIREALSISDFVKFARFTPTAEEMRKSLQQLRTGINQIEKAP